LCLSRVNFRENGKKAKANGQNESESSCYSENREVSH